MNPTTELLRAQYAKRFFVTTACVVIVTVTAQIIWLGKTGDYLLTAIGVLIAFACASWIGSRDLCRRWQQLRQLSVMHEHGPYDRREYIPPHEAARQLGDGDGPNMWR